MIFIEAKQKIEIAQNRCEIDIQKAIYLAMDRLREEINPLDINVSIQFWVSNDGKKHPQVRVRVEI